jgi:hypothetical protein
MKIHPTVPTVLVLATAVLTGLTGCGAISGSATPAGSSIPAGMGQAGSKPSAATSQEPETAETTGDGTTNSAPKHSTGPKTKPKTKSTTTSPTHAPSGPRIVSFKVVQKPKCAEGTAVFRAPAVPLIIKWKITGAESGALSVDDPTGTPGTYGPVALSGTQEFAFSCGGPVGSTETHTYAIYSVGGGTRKHKTLKVSAKVLDQGKDLPPAS